MEKILGQSALVAIINAIKNVKDDANGELASLKTQLEKASHTAGNGVDITNNIVSLKLDANSGLKFNSDGSLTLTLDTELVSIVSALPTENISKSKIYIVTGEGTATGDSYPEYVWNGTTWEKLGDFVAKVDLADYITTADAETKIDEAKSELETAISTAKSEAKSELETAIENVTFIAGDNISISADKTISVTGMMTESDIKSMLKSYGLIGLKSKIENAVPGQVVLMDGSTIFNVNASDLTNYPASKYKAVGIVADTTTDPSSTGIMSLAAMSCDTPGTGSVTAQKNICWGDNSTDIPTIANGSGKKDGKDKTAAILACTVDDSWKTSEKITNSYSSGQYPAAECCWRYNVAGELDQGDWYLPADAEFKTVYTNKSTISDTITALNEWAGKTVALPLGSSLYWSSSEYDSYGAYYVNLSNGNADYNFKDNYLYVRAFLRV